MHSVSQRFKLKFPSELIAKDVINAVYADILLHSVQQPFQSTRCDLSDGLWGDLIRADKILMTGWLSLQEIETADIKEKEASQESLFI